MCVVMVVRAEQERLVTRLSLAVVTRRGILPLPESSMTLTESVNSKLAY